MVPQRHVKLKISPPFVSGVDYKQFVKGTNKTLKDFGWRQAGYVSTL